MGINMPSKTSVFVGDAVYINAMNYRQVRVHSAVTGEFGKLPNVESHPGNTPKVTNFCGNSGEKGPSGCHVVGRLFFGLGFGG